MLTLNVGSTLFDVVAELLNPFVTGVQASNTKDLQIMFPHALLHHFLTFYQCYLNYLSLFLYVPARHSEKQGKRKRNA